MWKKIITGFIVCLVVPGFGQSIYTEFGKNRVQYHDDFKNWWMYETENFVTYWYGKGRNIAQSVIQIAEHDNDEIQNLLEHRFNDKIEIIVYVDLTDLKQSNLGAEEIFTSTAGRTKILGNKMFVYFDGNHLHLRQSIRQGIAAIYLESMLYGTNLQEVVQNAVLLNLPEWYKEGLVAYVADGWTPAQEDMTRDILSQRNGKFRDFYRLAKENPTLAGHSLWYYISETYGKSTIANILYLTRINRNFDNAILYVLGVKFDDLIDGWQSFIEARYPEDASWTGDDLLNLPRRKANARISALSLSPDGKTLAYALNDAGKTQVYLYNTQTGAKKQIFHTGKKDIVQEPDYQYPLFAWRRDRRVLSILYEARDVVYLTDFDLDKKTRTTDRLAPNFQRVYAMDYWHPDTLVMAASTDGFSDLYKYSIRTRQAFRITQDFFDDLGVRAATIDGTRGLLFASNRTDTLLQVRPLDKALPLENFDIYFMYPSGSGWTLKNLTRTRAVSETQPEPWGDDGILMRASETGQLHRELLELPDGKFSVLSDDRVVTHQSAGDGMLFSAFVGGGMQRLVRDDEIKRLPLRLITQDTAGIQPQKPVIGEKDAMDFADPRYLFQAPFARPESAPRDTAPIVISTPPAEEIVPEPTTETDHLPLNYNPSKVIEFNSARAIAHRLRFKLDYVTTTMDNSLLFTSLDTYAGEKQQYENPPLGILLKANLKDLFEDYVIEGGARFPTSFDGSEYFLYLDDLKKRFDKRYAFYRKTSTTTVSSGPLDIDRTQYVTVIGQYRLSYPFDTYTSLRGTATLRNDRVIKLATDASNLNTRTADDQRFGLKLEYVYDNTVLWDVNSRTGTRYKLWTELVKKFDLNLFEPGDKLTFNKGFMTVFGLDVRHYQPLDRHSVLAMRLFASTSVGSERILYYLGGVENQLFSTFDNTIPVPNDKNFAYQTIAANMRGFDYNARNGSSVVLINTELRVPFVRYLSRGTLQSAFLRNLQAVGFVDVGTAWHGRDPFSAENPLNTLTLTNPPTVQVDVKYFRNPVIVGYGAGLHALLFGYYLKADYAWGIETKRRLDPKLHLSLGLDF